MVTTPPVMAPTLPGMTRARLGAAPLFHATWLFALGITAAHWLWFRPGWLLLGLGPLVALAVLAAFKAPRATWAAQAAVWLVLGALAAELEPPAAPAPQLAPFTNGLMRTIEGVVVDAGPVRIRQEENLEEWASARRAQTSTLHTQTIDLRTENVEAPNDESDDQQPATGQLRITLRWPRDGSPAGVLGCGQRIRLVGRPQTADEYRDPNVWSHQQYLLEQGITASSSAAMEHVEHLGRAPGLFLPCRMHQLQGAASARLLALPQRMRGFPDWLRISPDDAVMLAAIVAGDRTYLSRSLRVGFERTGSFHMLVVSGLHLAIVAGCLFWVARRLRMGRVTATLFTLSTTCTYAVFTGFATPVQRSFTMVALYMLGRLLYRERSRMNVVGFAALCLLTASPRSLFDASFQMTLLAVVTIAGIAAPLLEATVHPYTTATRNLDLIAMDMGLAPRVAQFRVMLRLVCCFLPTGFLVSPRRLFLLAIRWLLRAVELLAVCVVVEIGMMLPMALYFNRITILALPVNLLILPILSLLMPSALALLAALALWPWAAPVSAMPAAFMLHLGVGMVRWFGNQTLGDWRIPAPLLGQSLLFCALLAAAMWLATYAVRSTRRWAPWCAALTLALAALTPIWPRAVNRPQNAMLVEAIDVGQGDSLLLITPDGRTLLIDGGGFGGGPRMAAQEFDIGEEVVSQALWARGIRHLDAVALSHAHSDHMGGLPAVLRNFHPAEFWVGNNPHAAAYDALLGEAATLGVRVRSFAAGQQFSFGAVQAQVLAPATGYTPGDEPENNDSLVLRMAYKTTSALLMGDAEAPVEQELLRSSLLGSSLLKVGHHGSRTSTTEAFLGRVAPGWAVISCGRRNRYGHPHPEVLEELEAAHVRTFSTDLNGISCFQLDGQAVAPDLTCGGASTP